MKKLLIILLTLAAGYVIISCNAHAKAETTIIDTPAYQETIPGYRWTECTSGAAFPKSYNFQLFSFRDTLWAFHPGGNWYTKNGTDWAKSALPNSINNLAFLDYVQFNNSILGLGHFEGNIERYKLTTEIYQTRDMRTWTILAKKSNLPERFFYHPFVLDNKIWIIGGTDGSNSFSDIWNSTDGVHWAKQADDLPFGKREGSQFVALKNRVYMINNDVWSSPDGLNWVLETKELVKGKELFGGTAVVFDNRIWLLGCNRDGKFTSEILVSDDGKEWTAQRAPWSPRGGIAACVYNGKIFMTGGKYGGPGIAGQTTFIYSNDVWSLEK
ncbi:MAG TPA: hypothetical protein PLZ45_14160 [Ferruginibacter sp.]|nr:hypothetical protein [Chitinophagaceae bacterium]HRI25817.1 hypothetical protein [Ferruginibacter sp.]